MRSLIAYLLFSLALLPCCSRAQRQHVDVDPLPAPALAARKDVTEAAPAVEKVVIGGQEYLVPEPWLGHKIEEKSPAQNEFARIPPQFCWQESQLYLKKNARDAFKTMAEKALEDGIELVVHSAFRSVWYQKKIFTKLMAEGRTWDDLIRYVAPPGYSEHMLGTVVDLYPSNWRFASTQAYNWLKVHGAEFGFVESYPEYSTHGFPWEAWHWRYQGL